MRERTLVEAFDELHFAVEQLCIDIARDVRVQAFLGLLNGLLERDFGRRGYHQDRELG